MECSGMKFISMQFNSLVDYPGKIVSVLYTGGCNFRCDYCHNPKLIDSEEEDSTLYDVEIINRIKTYKHMLDGLVVTGGEPSLWSDNLIDFFKLIKRELGKDFLIKLDTNGSNPFFIERTAGLVDYIALDYKGKYGEARGTDVTFKMSLDKIVEISKLRNGFNFEVRLTMYPDYIKLEDMDKIVNLLNKDCYYTVAIQQYNPTVTLRGKDICYSSEELAKFSCTLVSKLPGKNIVLRGV